MFSYFKKAKEQKELFFQLKREFEKDDTCLEGWYIIFKEDICLYVGQSKNLPSRVATHLKGKYKNCDKILVYENHDSNNMLDITEKYLMNIFKPLENVLVDFTKDIKVEEIAESSIMYASDNPHELKMDEKELILHFADIEIVNSDLNIIVSHDIELDIHSDSKMTNFILNKIKKVYNEV